MFDTAHFGNTGLEAFYEAGTSIGIAHKLGGDNMGLLKANRQVCEILGERRTIQSYSVSAFRSSKREFNTTSQLIEAGESQDGKTIIGILSEIENFHTELLENILCSCDERIKKQLIDYARDLFDEYNSQVDSSDLSSCQKASDYMLGVGEKAYSLLSVGEVIAAKVFVRYLELHGIPAVYVDTTNLRNITPSEVSARVQDFLVGEFERIYIGNSEAIPIIPGYIGGIQGGILPRLGRGYTDFTGERAAVSMHESGQYDRVLLYIQKMYGFKSTDPRKLEDPSHAKSVNALSYRLAKRAISHRGANAGLINTNALSHDIVQRKIGMLVGNPTNNSDVAFISERGNSESEGVELVLGRDYNAEYDDRIYNRVNRCSQNHHIVYLMGENMQNMGKIYARASGALKSAGITDIAGESSLAEPREFSFVFKSKEDAQKAQRVLHRELVERK